MEFIKEYLSVNYLTVMMLFALSVIIFVNRKNHVKGVKLLIATMMLVLFISILEYAEIWIDRYHKPIWTLYVKTMFVYWFYPLIVLLELYLTVPIKHKVWLAVPQAVNMVLNAVNASGITIIYGFHPNHSYHGGSLHYLPTLLVCFYALILTFHAVKMIRNDEKQKGCIILYLSTATIITTVFEITQIAEDYTDEISALGLLVYYWHMTAVHHNKVQQKLYQSKLELEQSKNKLLVAQIQPHFIFNSLMCIQDLCYTDGETAAQCLEDFAGYLRGHIDAITSDFFVPFETELEHIQQYIALEKAGRNIPFEVKFILNVTDFNIPALTVQPIVENAVKHGALSHRNGTGKVIIRSEKVGDAIHISVEDNGQNASLAEKQKNHRSIGIENVRKRLSAQCDGILDISINENGTKAVIIIPKQKGETDVHNDS